MQIPNHGLSLARQLCVVDMQQPSALCVMVKCKYNNLRINQARAVIEDVLTFAPGLQTYHNKFWTGFSVCLPSQMK